MVIQYLDAKRVRGVGGAGSTGWTLSDNTAGNSTITASITDAVLTTGGVATANGSWYGGASYDIGTANINDATWVLRFKVVNGTIAFGDGNAHHNRIVLSETAGVAGESFNEDLFGLEINCNTGTGAYKTISRNGSSGYSYVDTGSDPTSNQTYYVEIIRTASDTGTVKLFSNSDYSTGQLGSTASVSSLSSITGFRYIKSWQFSQRPSTQSAAISDIKFWNAQTNTTGDPDLHLLYLGDREKTLIAGVDGTWSAGGALASDVTEPASGGNSDDAIVMGGYAGSNSGITTTQEYDGSSWSAGGNLTAPGGSTCGGGTSSDAIIMTAKHSGANVADFCQEYDGTSWSDGGNPNTDRHNAAGDGNSSDAICVGGSPSASETYNGSSWTDIAEVTGRENFAAGGTSTSAICFGATVTTETWNGTAWSAGGNMTQANGGNEGGGLPTNAITIGGTTDSDMTEKYNGTAWAAVDLLTTGRGNHAGKGNNLNAFCAGGGSTSTEERTSTPDVLLATYLPENTLFEETNTQSIFFLQSGAWVAAAYTGAYGAMYCGGGGESGGQENAWDLAYVSSGAAGGSWTQVTDMSNEIWAGCGGGGKSNMILMGGHDDRSGDSGELDTAYKWNGTVWSSLTSMDRKRNGGKGGGSASDAMTCGGRQGGYTNTCVEWNGSSWSAGGGMGRIRFKGGADGSTTDGICGGGYSTSNALTNVSETYNGSTWSNSGNLGGAWYVNGIVGGSADALEVGHYAYVGDCYKFNGSSWSSTTALNASVGAVGAAGGDGTSSSASSSSIQIGGLNSANSGVGKSSEIFDGTAWTTKDDAPYNSQEPFVGVTDL